MSQIKRNVFYNALLTTSSLILPFITFPYVTRVLAPEGIGQVNFATSFIQYFVIISSLGVPIYGIREIARVKGNIELRSSIFFELVIIKLLCSLLALIIYAFLIFSVSKLNASLPYFLWGFAIIIIAIFDFNYFFNALEDFRFITIRSLFFQLVSVASIFIFIRTKEDALKYFMIPIFISLLNTAVNTKYILKHLNFQALKSKINLRRHLKPLILLFSIIFFTSVYNLLDTTILGFLSGNEQVGYYSVALKISRVLLALTMALGPVMLPRISIEFGNENYLEIKRLISKSIQFVILLGIPFMVGLYVVAPEVITLLSGKDFIPSIDTIRIMSPIPLIIGITTIFSTQLLIPMGRDKQLLFAVIFGTAASLTLNFILIPVLQHNGAAVSNLVAEIVVLISCFIYVSKNIQIIIPYRQIVFTMLLCLPFSGFIFIARQFLISPVLILMATISISASYYLAIQIFIIKNSILIEFKETVKNRLQNIVKY
jgi:O-antigen/teichoic acid export membrane protein